MRRADAFALVRAHGGKPRQGVTKQTNVLIVGELGWPVLDNGARAKSYHVLIASERQFLQWLGKSALEEQAKTYTADQLAAFRAALHVRSDRSPQRPLWLPRSRSGAMLAAGTVLSVITKSLHEIRKWLPDAGLSNLKLFPESSDRILVEQMNGHSDKTGQFVLEVEKPADNADAVFEEAQAAEERSDIATAER